MRRECGTGQQRQAGGPERGSRVPGAACWCSLCLAGEGEQGMRGGRGWGHGAAWSFFWVQAWRAAGQMPAHLYPALQRLGFLHWKMSPSAGPLQDAARQRRDCTPEVDAAGASGDPATARPEIVNAAPLLRAELCQSRPFVPRTPASAPA